MHPSLLLCRLRAVPLTLALSLGRGSRFVDAGNMLEMRAAPQRVCEHNNQHCAPKLGERHLPPPSPLAGEGLGMRGKRQLSGHATSHRLLLSRRLTKTQHPMTDLAQ